MNLDQLGGTGTSPLCAIMLSATEIGAGMVPLIWKAMDSQGYATLLGEQTVYGDLTKQHMAEWPRTARSYRIKLVQVTEDCEAESLAPAIYARIMWKACEIACSTVRLTNAVVVSVPDANSGACSIFCAMCEKLQERNVLIFGVGALARDEVPQDLLRDVFTYIPLSVERGGSVQASSVGSTVAHGVSTHASSLQFDHSALSGELWANGCTTSTQPSPPAARSRFLAGSLPASSTASVVLNDGSPRPSAPSMVSESVLSGIHSAEAAPTERPSSSLTAAERQQNFLEVARTVTAKLKARGGPPYPSLADVVAMAEAVPSPTDRSRPLRASECGEFSSFVDLICSMKEVVVSDVDSFGSVFRTVAFVAKSVSTTGCMDGLVVWLADQQAASRSDSDDSDGPIQLALNEPSSASGGSRPMSNFSKYVPLETRTKLEYYPVALALFNAVHILRGQQKLNGTLSSKGVPLSQVVQYVQEHYAGKEYQYKSYGFGKVTGLIAELPEIFKLSTGQGNLPNIMWVHDAPRRLAWMKQHFKATTHSNVSIPGTTSHALESLTATAAPQAQAPLSEAKKLLLRALRSLYEDSLTVGVEGFLPSVVVGRVYQLSGEPFDPKRYGHARLKPLVMCFSDSIEWCQMGSVDYMRLREKQKKDERRAVAKPMSNAPTVFALRKPTYRDVLDSPPAYGTEGPPPPPFNEAIRESGVLPPFADSVSNRFNESDSSDDEEMPWTRRE